MAFCPLDYRYGNQDFKHIWSESVDTNANSKLNVRSFGHIGNSVECLKTITMQCCHLQPESVRKERVSEIEAETRHDIMALTKPWQRLLAMQVGAFTLVQHPTTLLIRRSLTTQRQHCTSSRTTLPSHRCLR